MESDQTSYIVFVCGKAERPSKQFYSENTMKNYVRHVIAI